MPGTGLSRWRLGLSAPLSGPGPGPGKTSTPFLCLGPLPLRLGPETSTSRKPSLISSSSPFHLGLPFATARIVLHHPSPFPSLSPQLVCEPCMGGNWKAELRRWDQDLGWQGELRTPESRAISGWTMGSTKKLSHVPGSCRGCQLGEGEAWVIAVPENRGCFKPTRQIQNRLLSSFDSSGCYLSPELNNNK